MKSKSSWFLAGFAVGFGSLLGILAIAPGIVYLIHNLSGVVEEWVSPSRNGYDSGLHSDLQTIRSQLELYKLQHLDRSPYLNKNGKPDPANFIARLTGQTDEDGKLTTSGQYGPYLLKFPTNPLVAKGGNGIAFGTVEPAPGNGTTGWYFNTQTEKFSANDPQHTGL